MKAMTIQEIYISVYEVHLLIQAALLAYILGLPGKGPVKRSLTWVVAWFNVYAAGSVFLARATFGPHVNLPSGTNFDFLDFPTYLGFQYVTWMAVVISGATFFLIASLNFWYVLLNRKRDWQLWFYILSAIAVALYALVLKRSSTTINPSVRRR